MTHYIYRLIDSNTGEEVEASEAFTFVDVPLIGHHLIDAALIQHYGGPAIVNQVNENKVPESTDIEVLVSISAVSELLNDDDIDRDQGYRRS